MDGAMGSSTGWKPALGLWNNWKPGCPVPFFGPYPGGHNGASRQRNNRWMRKEAAKKEVSKSERPNVRLQASSDVSIASCLLFSPPPPRYNLVKTFMIRSARPRRQERANESRPVSGRQRWAWMDRAGELVRPPLPRWMALSTARRPPLRADHSPSLLLHCAREV